jgi:hypothetical protein
MIHILKITVCICINSRTAHCQLLHFSDHSFGEGTCAKSSNKKAVLNCATIYTSTYSDIVPPTTYVGMIGMHLHALQRIRRLHTIQKGDLARCRLLANQGLHLSLSGGLGGAPNLPHGGLIIIHLHLLHDEVFGQVGVRGGRAVVAVKGLERADAYDALAEEDILAEGEGDDAVGHDFGLGAGEEGAEGPEGEAVAEWKADGGGVTDDFPGLGRLVTFATLLDL